MSREPRTEAGRNLVRLHDRHQDSVMRLLECIDPNAPRIDFRPLVLAIEVESRTAIETALEAEWYNGNLDESAYDRILKVVRAEER